jgi:hypothetical protein
MVILNLFYLYKMAFRTFLTLPNLVTEPETNEHPISPQIGMYPSFTSLSTMVSTSLPSISDLIPHTDTQTVATQTSPHTVCCFFTSK